MKTRIDVAMALAFVNLPAAAYAADGAGINEEQMVVTATGFSQERREAPATISVLDEKALNTRSNQNVTEALREMPGVLVGNGHGSGDRRCTDARYGFDLYLVYGERYQAVYPRIATLWASHWV